MSDFERLVFDDIYDWFFEKYGTHVFFKPFKDVAIEYWKEKLE